MVPSQIPFHFTTKGTPQPFPSRDPALSQGLGFFVQLPAVDSAPSSQKITDRHHTESCNNVQGSWQDAAMVTYDVRGPQVGQTGAGPSRILSLVPSAASPAAQGHVPRPSGSNLAPCLHSCMQTHELLLPFALFWSLPKPRIFPLS